MDRSAIARSVMKTPPRMEHQMSSRRTSGPSHLLWIKIGIVRHTGVRRFRPRRRTDTPIRLLVDVKPYDSLDERETVAQGGNDVVDPFSFVSTGFSGGHLSNQNRFFPRCKQRVNVLEHLL